MATTHGRIRYTLRRVASRETWANRSQIAKSIRRQRPKEMKIRGDGSAIEHYVPEQSIGNLLKLMAEFDMIVIQDDGKVSVSGTGKKALADPETFDLHIQASVKTKLDKSKAPIAEIYREIRGIRPPLAPDAATIYDRLKNRDRPPTIGFDEFRQLLYLYACAHGIERFVRVYYFSGEE